MATGEGGPFKVGVDYKVEKKIVQPEDVTRAKSNAWLDLISPVTEWAGLKGDQLRHKRELLRIQQDETLIRVGKAMRKRLDATKEPIEPIPAKALVPFLEQASLEDPDSILIEAWANLGVSAAVNYDIEVVRFSKILSEIGPREKSILETIVGPGVGEWGDRSARALASVEYEIYNSRAKVRKLLEEAVENLDASIFQTMKAFTPEGYPLVFTKVVSGEAGAEASRPAAIFESDFYDENASGIELLKQNELVREGYAGLSWYPDKGEQPIGIGWVTLTELGFAFVDRVLKQP